MLYKLLCSVAAICCILSAAARNLAQSTEKSLDSIMRVGLARGYYPGAQLLIGDRNGILFSQNYGWQDAGHTCRVASDNVYDLASLTKVVATTFAVMRLYDRKQIDINKQVGEYIADFRNTEVDKIPINRLLTHTSGLGNIMLYKILYTNAADAREPLIHSLRSDAYPYYVDTRSYLCREAKPDSLMLARDSLPGYRAVSPGLYVNPLIDTLLTGQIARSFNEAKRGHYLYSDLNFHILKMIVERITGESLDSCARKLFNELNMRHTGYHPLAWTAPAQIVPTEDDLLFHRGLLRGYTHDEIAAVSNNAGGNAGLFSNARDLSHFCEMMMNEGRYGGRQVISAATVNLFTSTPLAPLKIYRGLGFDCRGPDDPLHNGYGHTGFTGTMIWMAPHLNCYMIFLSNRINPSRTNKGLITSTLRTAIWEKLTEVYQK